MADDVKFWNRVIYPFDLLLNRLPAGILCGLAEAAIYGPVAALKTIGKVYKGTHDFFMKTFLGDPKPDAGGNIFIEIYQAIMQFLIAFIIAPAIALAAGVAAIPAAFGDGFVRGCKGGMLAVPEEIGKSFYEAGKGLYEMGKAQLQRDENYLNGSFKDFFLRPNEVETDLEKDAKRVSKTTPTQPIGAAGGPVGQQPPGQGAAPAPAPVPPHGHGAPAPAPVPPHGHGAPAPAPVPPHGHGAPAPAPVHAHAHGGGHAGPAPRPRGVGAVVRPAPRRRPGAQARGPLAEAAAGIDDGMELQALPGPRVAGARGAAPPPDVDPAADDAKDDGLPAPRGSGRIG